MAVFEAKDETFDELTKDGVSIIDFYSTHCGPCRVLLPVLLQIENELPFINLVKVNTDFCPELTDRFGIMSLPTLWLAKDGNLVPFEGIRNKEGIMQAVGGLLYD